MLERLHAGGWDPNRAMGLLAAERDLVKFASSLSEQEREILGGTVYDPDALMRKMRHAERLVDKLTELNLIIRVPEIREPYLWADAPAPKKATRRRSAGPSPNAEAQYMGPRLQLRTPSLSAVKVQKLSRSNSNFLV